MVARSVVINGLGVSVVRFEIFSPIEGGKRRGVNTNKVGWRLIGKLRGSELSVCFVDACPPLSPRPARRRRLSVEVGEKGRSTTPTSRRLIEG